MASDAPRRGTGAAILPPSLRKLALVVHLACSVGWIGGVVVYLALGVAAATSQDAATVRGAWIAMELAGWWALVPLAVGTLVTGVALSLGTAWGLFRHYWVLISLALTVLCTAILVLHMPSVGQLTAVARTADGVALRSLGGDLPHPTIGLVVLLAVMVLNVYKPRGLTPYGWRKQQAERELAG